MQDGHGDADERGQRRSGQRGRADVAHGPGERVPIVGDRDDGQDDRDRPQARCGSHRRSAPSSSADAPVRTTRRSDQPTPSSRTPAAPGLGPARRSPPPGSDRSAVRLIARGQGRWVLGRDEHPGHAVLDRLRDAAGGRGDDRPPLRHRLDDRQPLALLPAVRARSGSGPRRRRPRPARTGRPPGRPSPRTRPGPRRPARRPAAAACRGAGRCRTTAARTPGSSADGVEQIVHALVGVRRARRRPATDRPRSGDGPRRSRRGSAPTSTPIGIRVTAAPAVIGAQRLFGRRAVHRHRVGPLATPGARSDRRSRRADRRRHRRAR